MHHRVTTSGSAGETVCGDVAIFGGPHRMSECTCDLDAPLDDDGSGGCETDADCSNGLECVNFHCLIACETDAECGPYGPCADGYCQGAAG